MNIFLKETYRCLENTGRGGFGSIFEVVNPRFGKKVAAKVVVEDLVYAGETELWSQLERENIKKIERFPEVTAAGKGVDR